MAATTTAKRVSRWIFKGSCSSVIAWKLGQPELEISVPIAGSLSLWGTCHIGADRLDILRACLWRFYVTGRLTSLSARLPTSSGVNWADAPSALWQKTKNLAFRSSPLLRVKDACAEATLF